VVAPVARRAATSVRPPLPAVSAAVVATGIAAAAGRRPTTIAGVVVGRGGVAATTATIGDRRA